MSNDAELPTSRSAVIDPVAAAPPARRLTAILLADVAGYSGMMSRDEDGTHARIASQVRELIDPTIKKYGGRFVRSMGDGTLVEFASARDAVRCGLDIQRGLAEREGGEPDPVRLRIGINTGDVLVDDRDIYGNSVNIAARLQALAKPGTVCVSQSIYDQTRSQPDLFFADHGPHRVKNISYPIHVFEVAYKPIRIPILERFLASRVRLTAIATVGAVLLTSVTITLVDNSQKVAARTNKIVVLPFRNVGGDAADNYLADAITDDLTTELSRLRHAWVIASATAFTYKDKPTDPREIGRALDVRYVLEGSVKRMGPLVRVNAQLIDTETGTNLWGGRFSHDTSSLLDLEDAVTYRLAGSLNVEVAKAGRRHEVGTLAGDGNPLDQGMKAMADSIGYPTPERYLQIRQDSEAGLRADRENARLKALLANVLIADVFNSWNGAGPAEVDRAEEEARKAIELEPNTALAHYALGFVHRVRNDHPAALASFQKAVDIDHSMAKAYVQAANEMVFMGNTKGAIAMAEEAIRRSPQDPSIGVFYWVLGRAYFAIGNEYPKAIEWLDKSVRVRPNLWFSRAWLIAAYALNNEDDKAKAVLNEFTEKYREWNLARITEYYATNDRHRNPTLEAASKKLIEGLRKAGLS